MYPKLSPNNGYRWCPLGKFSHMGLEQLCYCSLFWCNTILWGVLSSQPNNIPRFIDIVCIRAPHSGTVTIMVEHISNQHTRYYYICYLCSCTSLGIDISSLSPDSKVTHKSSVYPKLILVSSALFSININHIYSIHQYRFLKISLKTFVITMNKSS